MKLELIHNDNTDTFPKSPDSLATQLYRLVRSLNHIGIKVIKGGRTAAGRSIIIDFNNWNADRSNKQPRDEPSGILYECYYCKATPFKTGFKSEYEAHHIRHHAGKPGYPNHADIELLGLVPQGKAWEGKDIIPESVKKQATISKNDTSMTPQ